MMYTRTYGYYSWHPPMPGNRHHNPWVNPSHPPYYPWTCNQNTCDRAIVLRDYGPYPLVVNMDQAAKQNNNYRTALWTGKHLQVTLMSINPGDDIGLEVHPHTDQFIRIEEGQGLVMMGDHKDRLDFHQNAYDGYAIMVPAGKWHNVINTGHQPLKVYAIYAPPEHPFGTIHETKAAAMASEHA